MKKKFALLYKRFKKNKDPWGLNPSAVQKTYQFFLPIYNKYFKVRTFGLKNIKAGQKYLFVSNHSGQIAIDGMLISMALAKEPKQAIFIRPLVDRFIPKIPWLGQWMASVGAVVGSRQSCIDILKQKQSTLVFPEGTKGLTKNSSEYYQLKKFTKGFVKIARTAKVKIIPVAVVGAEEMFPFVYQNKFLNTLLGLPTLPISPCYFPLPSPVDIYFGSAYQVSSLALDTDKDVGLIKDIVQNMVNKGLKKRRDFAFTYISDL